MNKEEIKELIYRMLVYQVDSDPLVQKGLDNFGGTYTYVLVTKYASKEVKYLDLVKVTASSVTHEDENNRLLIKPSNWKNYNHPPIRSVPGTFIPLINSLDSLEGLFNKVAFGVAFGAGDVYSFVYSVRLNKKPDTNDFLSSNFLLNELISEVKEKYGSAHRN